MINKVFCLFCVKKRVSRAEKAVKRLIFILKRKTSAFINFSYQAQSWHKGQQCYSKIESTGLGINIRYFINNIPEQKAREIYFDFYLKRGEVSENRINPHYSQC